MKSLQHDFHMTSLDMLTVSDLELFLGHFHLGVVALVWSNPTVTATVTWAIIHVSIGGSSQAQSGCALPRNRWLVTSLGMRPMIWEFDPV